MTTDNYYIYKIDAPTCKTGFTYRFMFRQKIIKTSNNLDKLIDLRNEWLKKNFI